MKINTTALVSYPNLLQAIMERPDAASTLTGQECNVVLTVNGVEVSAITALHSLGLAGALEGAEARARMNAVVAEAVKRYSTENEEGLTPFDQLAHDLSECFEANLKTRMQEVLRELQEQAEDEVGRGQEHFSRVKDEIQKEAQKLLRHLENKQPR
jgi:ElaB/YqjD/DUF883 family membrane-anchored ribosome-binding protein